jgi:hypothetical protein
LTMGSALRFWGNYIDTQGEELMKCESAAEAKELLGLLENTHRVRWDALLLGKEAEAERIRLRRATLNKDRKKQMLVFSAGVRQARGETVEREMGGKDRADRAASALFDGLAGRQAPQSGELEGPTTGSDAGGSGGSAARAGGGGGSSSIDRILKQFSPRSGGALHSVAARPAVKAVTLASAQT